MSAGAVQVPLRPSSGRSPQRPKLRLRPRGCCPTSKGNWSKEGPELHLLMLSGYQIKLVMTTVSLSSAWPSEGDLVTSNSHQSCFSLIFSPPFQTACFFYSKSFPSDFLNFFFMEASLLLSSPYASFSLKERPWQWLSTWDYPPAVFASFLAHPACFPYPGMLIFQFWFIFHWRTFAFCLIQKKKK